MSEFQLEVVVLWSEIGTTVILLFVDSVCAVLCSSSYTGSQEAIKSKEPFETRR